jgi:type I restriction enzyme S subunit
MVDSPLGEIPEGWEAKRVSDAITINPKMKVPKEGEKPFIAMDNLSTNSMIIDGFNYKTGNSGSKFKNKDTLFARITPCLENGKTGFVQSLPANDAVAIGSTEFIVLRSKTIIPELVYLIARSEGFRDHAIKSMSGATGRQRVRENCFDNFLTAQPDNKILEKFQVIISPIFKNIHYLACKNANLRRTRDLLLPKLITGELDVDTLDIKTEGMTS